jgi:two-component system response regulator AtoC
MTEKKHILIVDDERTMREFLETSLRHRYEVRTASDGTEALEILKNETFDLILSDVQMPRMGGLELLDELRKNSGVMVPMILMTAFGTVEQAVKATHGGALDYLCKPFGLDQLEHVLGKALEFQNLRYENVGLRENISDRSRRHGLLGNHPTMIQLREQIRTIANSRGTVLVQGESGTGKEVVARAIHHAGQRRDGPFIRLNCAAIPETLLESELFGYERGAFTGAVERRAGKFELADGGTLLLDEISEMPFAMQAKLLRVLQEREFMPLGAKYSMTSDVRIIATTNRVLQEEVRTRRFREDLYYRLNVVPLNIVPLRQRKEDIPLLAGHFCQNFCAENDKPVMEITADALARMAALDWPGNVRQLQNVIERAVILGVGPVLDTEALGLSDEMTTGVGTPGLTGDMTLKDMERELILRKLQRTSGNRTRAASELGISVRTLRNKINQYHALGVEIPG